MRELARFLFLLVLIIALIAVGISFYLVNYATPATRAPSQTPGQKVEIIFTVRQGESTGEIAENLAQEGLISSPWIFKYYARFRGMDDKIEAGRYALNSDMTMREILETLTRATGAEEVTFTVREGLRLEEVAAALEEQGIVTAADFEAALKGTYNYDFLADRPTGASLEGYLFPDTYSIPRTFTATQVVDFMLQNFDRKFSLDMRQTAKAHDLTIFQVVTLASIIEREAVVDGERPIVASVYLNRLTAGMALDADPTVQYGLGYSERQQRWWPQIYFDELNITNLSELDNPYNTYLYAGLPPGPICGPGLASLQAVVSPAQTDYYYFVAKGDGSGEHAFAKTLEEHQANVAKYQP